jgi:hypothetical protein
VIPRTAFSPETSIHQTGPQVHGRLFDETQDPSGHPREETILTRALRSHQLWLTLTYLGLLVLMGRGLAG